jgi:hypothetical protein
MKQVPTANLGNTLLVLLSLTIGACGGGVAQVGAVGSDAGPSGTGSSTSATCPVAAPANGSACDDVGLGCQYGSNWIDCNQIATCTTSGWSLAAPAPSSCSASDCPASYASASAGSLDGGETPACNAAPGSSCWYPEGSCTCGVGGPALPGGNNGWACAPLVPGCPYPAPAPGSACPKAYDSQTCWYGGCDSSEPALWCTGGIWQSQGNECPL